MMLLLQIAGGIVLAFVLIGAWLKWVDEYNRYH
jgi:hypothetical protein